MTSDWISTKLEDNLKVYVSLNPFKSWLEDYLRLLDAKCYPWSTSPDAIQYVYRGLRVAIVVNYKGLEELELAVHVGCAPQDKEFANFHWSNLREGILKKWSNDPNIYFLKSNPLWGKPIETIDTESSQVFLIMP